MDRIVPFLLPTNAAVACQDQVRTVPPDSPRCSRGRSRPLYQVSGGSAIVGDERKEG
jgi:hypothetical protein